MTSQKTAVEEATPSYDGLDYFYGRPAGSTGKLGNNAGSCYSFLNLRP